MDLKRQPEYQIPCPLTKLTRISKKVIMDFTSVCPFLRHTSVFHYLRQGHFKIWTEHFVNSTT